METSQPKSSRACSISFFIGIFIVLFCCVKAEDTTHPEANANLSPFQQWRSAFYCLQNTTKATNISCPVKYRLTMSGWLNVTHEDTDAFCKQGCADHTRAVLECINGVKRDMWFANNANVQNLVDTVNLGCIYGFNGTSLYSGGYRVSSASISSALLALVLIALLNM